MTDRDTGKRPKMRDVAEKVGVSTSAVSQVLRGRERYVSAETLARIKEVVAELQYVPDKRAIAMSSSGGRITLKSIAQEVGVSISTVSAALKGRSDISLAKKILISEAAIRLGYTPNLDARSLSRDSRR